TSDVCQGLDHSISDYPLLIAGKGGGYLKYPGVHYRRTDSPNASDVLLTVMKSTGANVSSVGADSGFSSTECSGIKA
ncbi:MAG: hypothetical protein ACJ790_01780, partial [Myxococcaceae bacterium]